MNPRFSSDRMEQARRRASAMLSAGPSRLVPTARDTVAGLVASLVTLTYCLSFSALIFAGDLSPGLPMALWGFMLATAVVTLLSAYGTTLPPVLAGPRNPSVAVMAVLATTIGAAGLHKGLGPEAIARHVLLGLSMATLATGVLSWGLGRFRLGEAVRFIPYPVLAGFLAASGVLLVAGGIKLGAGLAGPWWAPASWLGGSGLLQLVVTVSFAALLLRLKRVPSALPVAIVLGVVAIELTLWLARADGMSRWHLGMTGGAVGWSPLTSWSSIDWDVLGAGGIEIASIVGVSIASLLLDASSLEVQRRTSADMDTEFRVVGAGNIAVFAIGGFPVGIALNPSRLTDVLGGRGRAASLASGVFIGALLASGLDLAGMVPRPVLGGMLVFLGIGIVMEAVKVPGRRSRTEFALTVLIMGAIVGFGYLTGVVLGIIAACLLFAVRYSRIDVIGRHVTRADLAAPVERSSQATRLLTEQGRRIHILWLSGFLFFGSSNRLFESIRQATAARGLFGRRWVVLDCSGVTGIDASALLSFQKLANWAASEDVALIFAGAGEVLAAELSAAGLFSGAASAPHFATRNEALEWAEERLIEAADRLETVRAVGDFGSWLAGELGADGAGRLISQYLERRGLDAGEIVCALGAPADTIELVASGSVAVVVQSLGNKGIRVRRMTGCTVVGEMGFFRGKPRAASVIAEEPAVVYVLTRTAYERMRADDPALCATVLQFVVRALADRLEAANREIGALI